MAKFRFLASAAALSFALVACAQTPSAPAGADPSARSTAPNERMAMMDAHVKAMREMHEKMSLARTPEERNALMAEHMKLMQQGMDMMGGMGMGGMGMGCMRGMGGMRGMAPMGAASVPMDPAMCQQMMERRMEMMQSMMQMMMDRMGASAVKP